MTDIILTPEYRKILLELVKREIQRLAVDANLYEVYHVETTHGKNAAQRRRLLKTILDELTEQETIP